MVAVRARGLSFRYGRRNGTGQLALQDCTFQVSNGEIYGILGPNGAGKTTLLRLLGTLLLPTSGSLEVLGEPIPGGEERIRPGLGIGSGEYERTFDFRLSAEENLRYFAAFYPALDREETRNRVAEVLASVGLSDAAKRPYSAFSQGMKHRLALARALLPRPKLLLLDEPTAGVDTATTREFLALVRAVADQGTTVLYTTHRLQEAGELCDRVLLLRGGRVVAEESPQALRRSAATDVLEVHLDHPPSVALLAELRKLQGVASVDQPSPRALRVHYEPTSEAPLLVLGAARAAGHRLQDFRRDAPSFEESYLRLTGGTS